MPDETSVEMQEVAEPVEAEESVENPEAAEPEESEVTVEDTRSEADARFAQMRRENRELQNQLAEQKRLAERYNDALGLFFQGDDRDLQAEAYYNEIPVEEVKKRREESEFQSKVQSENERLQEEVIGLRTDMAIAEGLSQMQKIDPSIKNYDDMATALGEEGLRYIAKGLSTVDAYFAAQSQRERTKVTPATPVGRANNPGAKKDYFSRSEVEAMSQEEVSKNFDLIRKSMAKWK